MDKITVGMDIFLRDEKEKHKIRKFRIVETHPDRFVATDSKGTRWVLHPDFLSRMVENINKLTYDDKGYYVEFKEEVNVETKGMTNAVMSDIMSNLFNKIKEMRAAGNKEYAHGTIDNVFNNFDRVAALTGTSREQVLYIYLMKHMDGIAAHIKGHKSQREPVQGRIIDAIVYLMLFYGMCELEDRNTKAPDVELVPRHPIRTPRDEIA